VAAPSPPGPQPALTPSQQAVIDLLGKGTSPRPELPDSLAGDLQDALHTELAEVVTAVPEDAPLFVSKHQLATVHSCEAHHQAGEAAGFTWSPAAARGTVAHRAIELLVNWRGEPVPGELVDSALESVVERHGNRGLQDYVAGLSDAERAELRGSVVDTVTTFLECFPPLKPQWRPVTESKVRVDLFGGRVTLQGRTDLTLGSARDKVIIDLKSGGTAGTHREDLRFYALVDTIRLGVPPRKVATYYLDAARAHPEDVTEAVLWAALRRTADGIRAMIELRSGSRDPTRRAGPTCRWCPLLSSCDAGGRYLDRGADPDAPATW
jgi:hypothetical protein